MEQTLLTFVGQLGFPIFTAVYFMTRMEKMLATNNKILTIIATKLDVEVDVEEK